MHFTIGENAGILLMQIAQEHLTERYDPEKALGTILDSLVGIPITMAREVLIGDKVLEVDVENQEFIVSPYNESKHEAFPKIDIKDWYIRTHKRIGDDGRNLYSNLGRALKYNSTSFGGFTKEFDFASIIEFIHGNSKRVLSELESDHRIDDVKSVIFTVKRFIEKANKAYHLMDWLEATYPEKYEPTDNPLESISRGRHNVVDMLDIRLRNLLGNGVQAILEEMHEEDQEVITYIEDAKNIAKTLEKEFEPVDILLGWDAGWLSPEGDYYALNGGIANMLHLNIADKLQQKGIIPADIDNKDSWLEKKGWVKIHKDWILYGGYLNETFGEPNIPLNEKQQDLIYRYGQQLCGGVLKIGFKQERISAARFQMINQIALKNLFSF